MKYHTCCLSVALLFACRSPSIVVAQEQDDAPSRAATVDSRSTRNPGEKPGHNASSDPLSQSRVRCWNDSKVELTLIVTRVVGLDGKTDATRRSWVMKPGQHSTLAVKEVLLTAKEFDFAVKTTDGESSWLFADNPFRREGEMLLVFTEDSLKKLATAKKTPAAQSKSTSPFDAIVAAGIGAALDESQRKSDAVKQEATKPVPAISAPPTYPRQWRDKSGKAFFDGNWYVFVEVKDDKVTLRRHEKRETKVVSLSELSASDRCFAEPATTSKQYLGRAAGRLADRLRLASLTDDRDLNLTQLALQDLKTSIALDDKCAAAHNAIAWEASTSPYPAVHDATTAIRHAKLALANTTPEDHFALSAYRDSLATAFARSGDFVGAVRNQKQALIQVESRSWTYDPGTLWRLALYFNEEPFTQPLSVTGTTIQTDRAVVIERLLAHPKGDFATDPVKYFWTQADLAKPKTKKGDLNAEYLEAITIAGLYARDMALVHDFESAALARGVHYLECGELDWASQDLYMALNLARRKKEPPPQEFLGICHFHLGTAALRLKYYALAETHLSQAAVFCPPCKDEALRLEGEAKRLKRALQKPREGLVLSENTLKAIETFALVFGRDPTAPKRDAVKQVQTDNARGSSTGRRVDIENRPEECPRCRGKGEVVSDEPFYRQTVTKYMRCPKCGGDGTIIVPTPIVK